jgi:uncharacterized protein (AIM24 family)
VNTVERSADATEARDPSEPGESAGSPSEALGAVPSETLGQEALGAVPTEGREAHAFLRHLRRAGELIGARRLPEGELELLKGLALSPHDLRALKLLALVRFKLGRLAEARDVYRQARELAPHDAAVRLNLGLIALKLDWFEEAVAELESAARLSPDDVRAWSYLGYAHARTGATSRAAAAFRRAGQYELAAEMERGKPSEGDPVAALVGGDATSSEAGGPATVASFAFSHLLSDAAASSGLGVLRFEVGDDAYVRQAALLASGGEVTTEEARRRKRGRLTAEALGDGRDPFLRCRGRGEVWLTLPPGGRGLVPLTLADDVLYLREQRVVAFDEVVWECGRVPWDGLPLMQFRGSGRVVVDAARGEMVALRVNEGEVVRVAQARLMGWLGRIVAQSVRSQEANVPPIAQVACEGEGVLLLSKHGVTAQPDHQRPEPRDDGSGAAGPRRPNLHR